MSGRRVRITTGLIAGAGALLFAFLVGLRVALLVPWLLPWPVLAQVRKHAAHLVDALVGVVRLRVGHHVQVPRAFHDVLQVLCVGMRGPVPSLCMS